MIGKLAAAASVVPLTALLSAGCAAIFAGEAARQYPQAPARDRRRAASATKHPNRPTGETPCAAIGANRSHPTDTVLG